MEYSTDGINVYYAKSADEEGQFLYHAARKSEEGQSITDEVKNDLYEGEYCDYEVNEPSLQIKKMKMELIKYKYISLGHGILMILWEK